MSAALAAQAPAWIPGTRHGYHAVTTRADPGASPCDAKGYAAVARVSVERNGDDRQWRPPEYPARRGHRSQPVPT